MRRDFRWYLAWHHLGSSRCIGVTVERRSDKLGVTCYSGTSDRRILRQYRAMAASELELRLKRMKSGPGKSYDPVETPKKGTR